MAVWLSPHIIAMQTAVIIRSGMFAEWGGRNFSPCLKILYSANASVAAYVV